MAVDTRDKRMSMLGFGSPVPRVLPDPAGGFDAADRAMLLYLFHEDLAPPGPGPDPEPDAVAIQGPKTPLNVILRSVRAQLVAGLVEDVLGEFAINSERIFFSRINSTPRWDGHADVVLRVTAPRPLPGFWDGHGEVAPGVVRGLLVEIRTRSAIDISDRVDSWLLNQQSVIEDAVTLALMSFRAMDVDTPVDTLTIEGLSLAEGQEYRDTLERIQNNPDATWGSSILTFAIKYCVRAPDLPVVEE